MSDPQTTARPPLTAREFFDLRTSERRLIAKTFGLAYPDDDPCVSEFERGKEWLLRAKAQGSLEAVLEMARDTHANR